jgi:hypothetical protein
MDLIFDIPRLHHFIRRTESLAQGPFNEVRLRFSPREIGIMLGLGVSRNLFWLRIRCGRPDWQVASITQIFIQQSPLLSRAEQLEIGDFFGAGNDEGWKSILDMDPLLWLGIFNLFVAVQSLRVSKKLVPPIVSALQQLTDGMAIEVFPALRNLSLDGPEPSGPVREAIKTFVAARQLSGHPVAVQYWYGPEE